jgi:hypothetical protein
MDGGTSKMTKEFFLKCDCQEDGLSFVKYHDESEIWISHFKRSHKNDSLKDRLKLCWKILTNQEVDLWDVIVSKSKIEELKKFLNDI